MLRRTPQRCSAAQLSSGARSAEWVRRATLPLSASHYVSVSRLEWRRAQGRSRRAHERLRQRRQAALVKLQLGSSFLVQLQVCMGFRHIGQDFSIATCLFCMSTGVCWYFLSAKPFASSRTNWGHRFFNRRVARFASPRLPLRIRLPVHSTRRCATHPTRHGRAFAVEEICIRALARQQRPLPVLKAPLPPPHLHACRLQRAGRLARGRTRKLWRRRLYKQALTLWAQAAL